MSYERRKRRKDDASYAHGLRFCASRCIAAALDNSKTISAIPLDVAADVGITSHAYNQGIAEPGDHRPNRRTRSMSLHEA